MATIGSVALTYADWAKRMDDGYRVASIIELLSQTNEISRRHARRRRQPPHRPQDHRSAPASLRLRGDCSTAGVPNAKSTTAQIVDTCGNLETYAVIDKDIADLNGNTAEFRLSEVKAFLEGMSQQVAATLIYGNQHVNPERFTGLAPRYSTANTCQRPDRQQRPRRWRHLPTPTPRSGSSPGDPTPSTPPSPRARSPASSTATWASGRSRIPPATPTKPTAITSNGRSVLSSAIGAMPSASPTSTSPS